MDFQFDPAVELSISGNCPVQAEGKIGNLPFYFRARHDGWQFYIAAKPDGDPLSDDPKDIEHSETGPYGLTHEAGWMPTWHVLRVLSRCIELYVTKKRLEAARAATDARVKSRTKGGDEN